MSVSPPSVCSMKNYNSIHSTSPVPPSTAQLTADILFHHDDTLHALDSIMRHPRSLARPTPQWRPPSKALPEVPGMSSSELNMTVSRHRAGERARARVLGYGEKRVPSYLITVRVTDPTGRTVSPSLAEAWVRALVPPGLVSAVHEISSSSAATFVWLVDSTYTPVHSPLSLFEGFSQAA